MNCVPRWKWTLCEVLQMNTCSQNFCRPRLGASWLQFGSDYFGFCHRETVETWLCSCWLSPVGLVELLALVDRHSCPWIDRSSFDSFASTLDWVLSAHRLCHFGREGDSHQYLRWKKRRFSASWRLVCACAFLFTCGPAILCLFDPSVGLGSAWNAVLLVLLLLGSD